MYRAILLLLYAAVLIPAVTRMIKFRDVPSTRRLSATLGITGVVVAPYAAGLVCELLTSVFSFILLLSIIIFGIRLMMRSLFR